MRLISTILFVFLSLLLSAQVVVPCDSQRVENSKRNYHFALMNKGKKVGVGLCREFVYKAIKRNHKDDFVEVLKNAGCFEIKDKAKVIKGDIVTFKNVKYRDDVIDYHIGIIIDTNESGFFYAHQNAGDDGDETAKIIDENGKECNVFVNSKVEAGYFEYKDQRCGMVQFFRF